MRSDNLTRFGRQEVGWEVYAPLVQHEIGSACAPGSPGFVVAVERWRSAHGLGSDATAQETIEAMRLIWHRRRPFVAMTAGGGCPAAPEAADLAQTRTGEGYGGMRIALRPAALEAYRRMVAAARGEQPAIGGDHQLLTIFSGFRSPAVEAARCAGGGCDGVSRARCSAHRTGTAVDLYLGGSPGRSPGSSADADRLSDSRTIAYRWLVANADRFGFKPYAFEPWHWEWAGEPTGPPASFQEGASATPRLPRRPSR